MTEGGLRTRGVQKRASPGLPLISIITVVFNGASHLEQAINSILGQSYTNIEYLIIDGGSFDGSLEIIKRYDEFIDYWITESDNGIYDALNKGLTLIKGDVIGLLSADDYYEPDALLLVANAFTGAGESGILYGDSYILQEDLDLRYLSVGKLELWRGMTFKHQAMFVPRRIHQRIGIYNTSYRIAGDYEFVLRAMKSKIPFFHIDHALVDYRNTGLSGMNPCASLVEAMGINMSYYGTLSREFAIYVTIFIRSCALRFTGKMISLIFGKKMLTRARLIYTKKMFAK